MANGLYEDLRGTSNTSLQIALGGVNLVNSSGNLIIRNAANNADSAITASVVNLSGATNQIVLNSGGTHPITINGGAATATYTLTLPETAGSPSQVLSTDGSGVLSWTTVASTSTQLHVASTTVSFGDTSPSTSLGLPANALVVAVKIIVDTAFDGTTPTMSVGIVGTVAKYFPTTAVDLATPTMYVYHANAVADVSGESVFVTSSLGGSTAGSARILIEYVVPAAF